jgi:phenylpropionate dioxygenase-like ring-hydroxylating dioxygenase large terminal subunit
MLIILFFIYVSAHSLEFTFPVKNPFFNHWNCIGIKTKIDFAKPYAYNIGDLPLVLWKNNKNKLISTINVCKHMGSKLETGKIVNGCLKCPYHGLEFSEKDKFGEIFEQDGKIFWAYQPFEIAPPKTPFFDNKNFVKSFVEIDMDCSLQDSVYNTMDIRHPEYVHGIGFGSSNEPQNIQTYNFPHKNAVGLTFDYQANDFMQYMNNIKKTNNYHMYIYPTFTWSRVSFVNSKNLHRGNNHLIISVNFLPIGTKKTKWFVTILHNYNKSPCETEIIKLFAKIILLQDFHQLKNQYLENTLKERILLSHTFENEQVIQSINTLLQQYNYPNIDNLW